MIGKSVKSGLHIVGEVIRNIYNENDDALKLSPDINHSGKITGVLSKFIVTPNIVIDENLKYMDNKVLKNIIKTNVTVFTAIVTEAVRVMVEIYGQTPTMVIDKLSDKSTITDDMERIRSVYNGSESFDYVKDLYENKNFLPGVEHKNTDKGNELKNNNFIQKDMGEFINNYELQIQMNDKSGNSHVITLPILIYPNITYTKADTLINNLVDSTHGKTFFDVFNDYRAGLKSLADVIFATSLIKEYKAKKLKNDNDFAKYLNSVDKISTVHEILYNKNSFSKNFNIYIFDNSYLPTINKLVKGNVFKNKYKEVLTNKLMAFSVTFVDIEEEEISLLMDSIPSFSIVNFDMLQKEKTNSDVSGIMKELMNNKTPF